MYRSSACVWSSRGIGIECKFLRLSFRFSLSAIYKLDSVVCYGIKWVYLLNPTVILSIQKSSSGTTFSLSLNYFTRLVHASVIKTNTKAMMRISPIESCMGVVSCIFLHPTDEFFRNAPVHLQASYFLVLQGNTF